MADDLLWLDSKFVKIGDKALPQSVGVQAFLRFDMRNLFRKHSYGCFVCPEEEIDISYVYPHNTLHQIGFHWRVYIAELKPNMFRAYSIYTSAKQTN
jgi:hypothetical protein